MQQKLLPVCLCCDMCPSLDIMSIAVGEVERGNQMLQKLDEKVAEVKKRTGNLPRDKKKIVIGFSSLGEAAARQGCFTISVRRAA